jgi:hypothetical protein
MFILNHVEELKWPISIHEYLVRIFKWYISIVLSIPQINMENEMWSINFITLNIETNTEDSVLLQNWRKKYAYAFLVSSIIYKWQEIWVLIAYDIADKSHNSI